MAKMLNYAKITIEDDHMIYTFTSPRPCLSSTNGETYELSAGVLTMQSRTSKAKETPKVIDERKLPDPLVDAAKQGALKLVAGKARLIERQRLMLARLIQQAQEEAEAERNAAAHEFNLTVLGATHVGVTITEIIEYLDEQNLPDFEAVVGGVATGDVELLYPEASGA